MNKEELLQKFADLPDTYVCSDELMSKHTSFKVGGPADILVLPKSKDAVANVLLLSKQCGIPLTVLGNCSNILVKDKGIRGVVLKIGGGLTDIVVEKDVVKCGAGVLLSATANAALSEGLTGLEFAAGIPGSVGGGVFMNAGAYDGELKDVVSEVVSIDFAGKRTTWTNEQMQFAYRKSIFSDNGQIILSAAFKLKTDCQEQIKAKMDDFSQRRRSKQPLELPSAGSTFKRPVGYFAGKLIQEAGLCGLMVGGAQVSEKHAGFVVNKKNATAADILKLIEMVQEKVYKCAGVHLQPEVRIIGE